MQVKSYGSNIIAKKNKPISENGFVIPDDDKLFIGEIIDIGVFEEGLKNKQMKCLKEKAIKVYTDSDRNEYYSIFEDDILCIITDN